MGDPPPLRAGHVEVHLDPSGRLKTFLGTPAYDDVLDDADEDPGTPADFARFFEAAGLDIAAFEESEPAARPRSFADRRYAWDAGTRSTN